MDTLDELAGTMPDRQVAERLGVETETVKRWRREHGIAPFLRPPPGALGGSKAPAVPAADPGSSGRRLVRRRGDAEGVDVVAPRAAVRPTAPVRSTNGRPASVATHLDALRDRMGKVPDDEIAQEAGVSRSVVGTYRRKYGIPAYEGYLFKPGRVTNVHTRPAEKERGATAPSAKASVRRTSRLEAFAHLVGVESDGSVAAKAGLTRAAVTAWRRRHGIAAAPTAQGWHVAVPPRESAPPPAKRVRARTEARPTPIPDAREASVQPSTEERLAPYIDRMGKVADGTIGAIAGVSRDVVAAYRRKHGIAAWQGFRAKPRNRAPANEVEVEVEAALEPAPTASMAPTPSVRIVRVYSILASANGVQREFLAAGESFATVCARAEEGLDGRGDGPWTVDLVKLIGEAFA